MLDANELDDLVAVARSGSLSGAARRRGVAVSTIARRIDALEANLHLRLIDRRADGVRLTAAGAQIAELAAPLAEQIARVARAAEGLRAGVAAMPVRVTATEFVVSDLLAPALPALWAAGVSFPVHLQSQSDVVSLAARDADIAVRMSRPEGASLIVRKLGEIRMGFYATPEVLGDRDPAALDLLRERLLAYDDSYGRLPELDWMRAQGIAGALAMRTGSTRGLLTAARAGAGIALLPCVFGDADARLVRVAQAAALPVRTPWLVVHRDLHRLPNVRATTRWIVATFAAVLQPIRVRG
jgi:DNA-binding transcriptional LysR family regulator